MNFVPADPLSLFCYLLIIAAVLISFIWAAPPFFRKSFVVALGLWLFLSTAIPLSGLVDRQPQPFLFIYLALSLLGALSFSFSKWGRQISHTLPVSALIFFQVFRLPLELVLHSWALQGTIPETMTWNGSNFDILSGILALLITPFANLFRTLAWSFNAIGFLLLLNVLRVAIFSSPLPFAWHVYPPLRLAAYFPYCLIIPVCVGGALSGHVLLTRALLHRKDLEKARTP
jgi:hypothetical protein